MKKILMFVALVVFITVALSSCGNESLGFGSFTFEHAHIACGGTEGMCVDIQHWHNNELGIEILTTSGMSVYCAEGTYILFSEKSGCPFC